MENISPILMLPKAQPFIIEEKDLNSRSHTTNRAERLEQALRQLEDELAQQLLQRNSTQSRLTDAGRIVFLHAQAFLLTAANINAELAELKEARRGELRIGVPPLGPHLCVPVIRAYKLRRPEIELHFFEDRSRAIAAELIQGKLDLTGLLAPLDSLAAMSLESSVMRAHGHEFTMNSPGAKRIALSREFLGSGTATYPVAVAQVWVSPPRLS